MPGCGSPMRYYLTQQFIGGLGESKASGATLEDLCMPP